MNGLAYFIFMIVVLSTIPADQEVQVYPNLVYDPEIIISGTQGQNGWFISPVTVWFVNVSGIVVMYNLDNGGWTEYTSPFGIDTDAWHILQYYFGSGDVQTIDIKIDRHEPNIITFDITKVALMQYLISANVEDLISGINFVKFYVNNELLGVDNEIPFEWNYHGLPGKIAKIVVSDYAGNFVTQTKKIPLQISYNQFKQSHTHLSFRLFKNLIR